MAFRALPPFWASWLVAGWPALSALRVPSRLRFKFPTFPQLPLSLSVPIATELRIDVQHAPEDIEKELDALHERLYSPGDALYGIASLALFDDPDLIARLREADGETYIYIEDLRRQRLAGYIIFNRLIELNRVADRHLRAPHTKIAPAYQRRGLASAIYRWALRRGQCLVTGARQSCGAHALWERLADEYPTGFVRLENKTLSYLGDALDDAALLDDLHTRRLLLAHGWSLERLAEATRMRIEAEAEAQMA